MKKAFPIIVISLLFVSSMFILFNRQEKILVDKSKNRICLNENLDRQQFEDILIKNAYASTKEDAKLISEYLDSLLKEAGMKLPNLGSLNKWKFQIPASIIEARGGTGLKGRLASSYRELGCDSISMCEYDACPANLDASERTCAITVYVKDRDTHKGLTSVNVRLAQHKEVFDEESKTTEDRPTFVAYGKTNSDGEVTFNVDRTGFYSVLPIKEGYEFGVPKGTTNGKPIGEEKDKTFSFTQKEHRLRMFDRTTYARIKADDVFCVRSVSDYVNELVMISALFLLTWWCTFFFVRWKDNKLTRLDGHRYQTSDSSIIALLMLLNAICIFGMLAISNPLVDKDYANDMVLGTVAGSLGLCFFSSIDYVKYYSGQYKLGLISKCQSILSSLWQHCYVKVPKILRNKLDLTSKRFKERFPDKSLEGIGFLLTALLLVLLLWAFGTGPEGSDAKVNLWGAQPSEISKFLFITSIALFFTANAHKIQAFADGRAPLAQIKTLFWIVVAILLLLGLYIGMISDMGPALVLAVTFIILYSILRQDFKQMFLGVLSYLILLGFASNLPVESSLISVLWLSVLWFVVWFVGGYVWKKKIYESAGFMNLLILLFTHGGEFLKMMGRPHEGERLMRRIAASGDGVWDNTVRGGDQVAQGIWALSSGGLWGQGLGNGNANLVPAFNTDMIFESIGEVMGFSTLFVVLVCYALLIWRCLKKSNETGHPFLFYMIAGIGVVTTVQLFVILMGSLGIIPLTGVSLPFLSYGRSGLIVNLIAFGIVLGMSRNKPTLKQKQAIIGYNKVLRSGMTVFTLLFAVVCAYALNYSFLSRDTYLTKTAYITNLSGEHTPEQNPRINILLRNLHSGIIYDRNGVLLATSSVDTLLNHKGSLINAGITDRKIDSLSHTMRRRYYPFEEHLFFMIGDMNTQNLLNSVYRGVPYGYLAEERHIGRLRGIDIQMLTDSGVPYQYKISDFTAQHDSIHNVRYADYSNSIIVDMLKQGIHGNLVKEWNDSVDLKKRNLYLTIDAKLTRNIQNSIAANMDLISPKARPYVRISAVVLNANTGELLCSANYPLPDQSNLKDYKEHPNVAAYTERDLGLTHPTAPGSSAKVMSALASFEKLGLAANEKKYKIDPEEQISKVDWIGSGNVDVHDALVHSSNSYFVNLVHDKKLYEKLKPIYWAAGINVGSGLPYVFKRPDNHDEYYSQIDVIADIAYNKYSNYLSQRGKIIKTKEGKAKRYYEKLSWPECAMSWGQGGMSATPLGMARVVSAVANNGRIKHTNYILPQCPYCGKLLKQKLKACNGCNHTLNKMNIDIPEDTVVYDSSFLDTFSNILNDESTLNIHVGTIEYGNQKSLKFGGKSGTAERGANVYETILVNRKKHEIKRLVKGQIGPTQIMGEEQFDQHIDSLKKFCDLQPIQLRNIKLNNGEVAYKFFSNRNKNNKKNELWYICNVWSEKEKSMLSIAIRIERMPLGTMSGTARRMLDVAILRELKECGYITYASKNRYENSRFRQ